MRESSRPVVAALVAAVLVVLFAPDAILWIASAGRQFVLDAVLGIGVPQWALIGVGLIALLVVTFLIIFGALRLVTSVGVSSGSRVAYWYDRVTPDSPRTKGLAFMILFTVVFLVGIAAFVPYLSSSLTEGTGIDDVVGDIQQGRYGGAIPGLFEDDTVRRGDGDIPQKAPGHDTDGDGLLDSWEEAGATPGGASLPGADPDRMDLYVQLNYGSNVSRLDRAERRQLRNVWDRMVVENPDGTTGIDLHLVHRGDRAGNLGQGVPIAGSSSVDRFYTEERLGARYCRYHQVTLGQIQGSETIGYAEAPGRSSILDGSTFASYEGDVSFRVAMITHALLHNVVGDVSGEVHTENGWLEYPESDNERLSSTVAAQIERDGFVTSSFGQERCGPRPTPTPEETPSGGRQTTEPGQTATAARTETAPAS